MRACSGAVQRAACCVRSCRWIRRCDVALSSSTICWREDRFGQLGTEIAFSCAQHKLLWCYWGVWRSAWRLELASGDARSKFSSISSSSSNNISTTCGRDDRFGLLGTKMAFCCAWDKYLRYCWGVWWSAWRPELASDLVCSKFGRSAAAATLIVRWAARSFRPARHENGVQPPPR